MGRGIFKRVWVWQTRLRRRPSIGNSTPETVSLAKGATMIDLEQTIRERHSTRLFLPNKPVPRDLVEEALALAVCAPSNSNIQPWHVVFASGPPRERLVKALLEEAQRRPPNIPPLPESFKHFRSELGAEVYGAM